MNRLWVRLSLAFALVTVLASLSAWVLANRQVDVDFRQYLARSEAEPALVAALAEHWATQGDWQGAAGLVEAAQPGSGPNGGRGRRQGGATRILADPAGRVVAASVGDAPAALTLAQLQAATPIIVDDATVGYLYTMSPGRAVLAEAERTFLAQVNQALLQAGLIASLLGVLLGLVLARSLAAPLSRLATAARRLATGNLGERVRAGGTTEMTEAAQAFNDMAAALEQSETLRRNLVADIAHELRTPLTVVQGNLRAILDGVYPLEKPEIALIYDETLVLNRLIQDLRQLAQAEAGQLDLKLQSVNAATTVASLVANFAEQAAAQSIRLSSDLPADLPPILADPDRLRQMLANLLSNALRYTPAGGEIRVTARRSEATGAGEGIVRFTISDTGAGIASDQLPHVFDRFWRAETSGERESGGSGLGLAIVKHLVEAQGGRVGVTSELGSGSEFWVELPQSAQPPIV